LKRSKSPSELSDDLTINKLTAVKRGTHAHARCCNIRLGGHRDGVGCSYPALLTVFDDGNKMPPTWNEWLKMAEEMERGLKAYGHPVMRVRIEPSTFPDWCAAHGTTPGREGRKRFVAAAVTERYGDQT
jgi:hypothetical protein